MIDSAQACMSLSLHHYRVWRKCILLCARWLPHPARPFPLTPIWRPLSLTTSASFCRIVVEFLFYKLLFRLPPRYRAEVFDLTNKALSVISAAAIAQAAQRM